MIVLVLPDVGCAISVVFQHTVRSVVVETAESTVVYSGVILNISSHVHVDHAILHLSILLHFVLE